MKLRRKQEQNEELNFWQPASDIFSALLLILMLIILLLGLYLVQVPENDELDPDLGNSYVEGGNDYEDSTATPVPTIFIWIPDGGGGGGGGVETPHPTYIEGGATVSLSPSPSVTPTPDLPGGGGGGGGGGGEGGGEGAGEGPGDEPDLGLKSAIYVMLVDAETERTVKEAHVEFELYGENHALQILNSYYPERVTYRFYETTEAGTFYFPEKVQLGNYELHELTEPEGYDAAENIEFALDAVYDWSDPYVVLVPIYPSRNVIRLQMIDAETGRGIPNGTFDIVAAENIITSDGTLRYRVGQTVGEILCDENGYGTSEELYLGSYILRQRDIPRYYVGLPEDLEAQVEKKSDALPALSTVSSPRTKLTLKLTDEMYPTRGISGAEFSFMPDSSQAEPFEVTTDGTGQLTLSALEKGVTYRITQLSSAKNYLLDSSAYNITVALDGRINGEDEITLELQNRMIRVYIGITDEFSSIQVSNVSLSLFDAGGELVRTWTSTGSAQLFTDLAPGSYSLIKDGDQSTRYSFIILDQGEVQYINMLTSYLMHYIIIGASAAFVLIVTVVVILVIRRRRRRRREREG